MLVASFFVVSILEIVAAREGESAPPYWNMTDAQIKANLVEHVMEIIEHYKQQDPVGIPRAPIPDPMPIPDLKQSISLGKLVLTNATVAGLSKFRIDQIYSDVADMEVEIGLKYTKLEVIGNYTMTGWFTKGSGGFNVTIINVYLGGVGLMEVSREGHLEASNINMDISFVDIKMNFQNLGFFANAVQGMLNKVGTLVFDNIKPFILTTVNTNVRGDINKALKSVKKTFPNSIPPLDLGVAELRKYVRENGCDPYKVDDYNYSAGIITFNARQIWIFGLASFYRIGNVTISIASNTVTLSLQVATKRLKGKSDWEISLGGLMSRTGFSSFTVEYVEVNVKLNQSLNVRKTPKLEDLVISVGNIALRSDGLGTVDYVLEMMANILPNLLRYQITDALEGILKQRLQDNLNLIDIEKEIKNHLKQLESISNPQMNPNTVLYSDEDFPDDIELFDDVAT